VEWLNYHHLFYFWVVAKEGSIVAASSELRLAHPTISAQLHRLEESLGRKLFERQGRRLVLTDFGRVAQRYADDIFATGRELLDAARGDGVDKPARLVIGVSDALPKSIVYRILEPAFRLDANLNVICREDRSTEAFLGELAMHTVDVLIADAPAQPGGAVRAFSHPLGECGTSFFAAPALARSCRNGFPRSLDGAPFLVPGASSALRRELDAWFDALGARPRVVAEVDDAALAKVLGEAGRGVFVAPDVVEDEVKRRYGVELVGRAAEVRQRFFVISVERKIRHPAVVAMTEAARERVFPASRARPSSSRTRKPRARAKTT
jgi:LysR family transcriptional regulator, transcriptional activator of nhaA